VIGSEIMDVEHFARLAPRDDTRVQCDHCGWQVASVVRVRVNGKPCGNLHIRQGYRYDAELSGGCWLPTQLTLERARRGKQPRASKPPNWKNHPPGAPSKQALPGIQEAVGLATIICARCLKSQTLDPARLGLERSAVAEFLSLPDDST
jgi:hypothetical protein